MSLQAPEQTIDAVQLAIVQSALVGIAREMGTIMERASYSSILNEGKDFSCAVFGPDGELVAEGEFVLVHLAAMHEAVQVFIDRFGERWQPGDIAIHNDPYEGGSHLPDINLVRPVFVQGQVVAYVATRAHYPDVGGRVPGSFAGEAQTLFEEGIAIPPLLLARRDVLDEQLIALWSRNVRVPKRLRADLLAQVASVRIGEQRVASACDRYGLQVMRESLAEIPRHGERIMRRRIAERLTGERVLFDYMDDAGPESLPVRIELTIRVDGSRVCFDYRSSDPQVSCPINAPRAVVKSATYGALKCLLVPELPLTSGMFRPVDVLTKPGTVTEPTAPAPVAAGNTNTSMRVFDMCVAGLAELLDDSNGAAGIAGSYSANTDIGMGGVDPRSGDEFVLYMMPVGGIGAGATLDGSSAQINYMGNCASQPVEVLESMYPFRVTEYRLRPDSGGPGRRRGGLGLCLRFEIVGQGLEASVFTERQRFAPFGLRGGQPAAPGRYGLSRGLLSLPLATKTSGLLLLPGDVLTVETAGGGGYGDPWEREPALVVADVRNGFVSRDTAEAEYGVMLDGLTVDEAGTRMLRTNGPRPFTTLSVADIVDQGSSTVALPSDVAAELGATADSILYCFGPRAAVQVRASGPHDGQGAIVSARVAGVLDLKPDDDLCVRVLSGRWTRETVGALRKTFGRHVDDDEG